MSQYDPRDPRTQRYETGYDPQTRAYSQQPGQYPDPHQHDPYARDPYAGQRPATSGQPPKRRIGPDINPGLFAGGVVMSGVVTALAAWLVAWIIRAIVQRVNESGKLGVWNPVAQDEVWFALVAFLCALMAGALWYVLQMITPSPDQFYRWIIGLLIAAAVVIPLVLSQQFSVGIGTAVMHLVIGLPILSLIPAVGSKSIRR